MVELQSGLREVVMQESIEEGEVEGEDLWGLLRVVMEESEVDLEESLSDMLLRLVPISSFSTSWKSPSPWSSPRPDKWPTCCAKSDWTKNAANAPP